VMHVAVLGQAQLLPQLLFQAFSFLLCFSVVVFLVFFFFSCRVFSAVWMYERLFSSSHAQLMGACESAEHKRHKVLRTELHRLII